MDETIMSEHTATRQGTRSESRVENPEAGGAFKPRLGLRRRVGSASIVGQNQPEGASNTSSVPAPRVGATTARTALRSRLRATTCTLGIGLLLALASGLNPAMAHAVCGSDRPCFDTIYMDGPKTLVATWHGGNQPDFINYNVRYSSPGGPEPQAEVVGGDYRIYGVEPGTTYTLKVQSCAVGFLSYSKCTPWDTTTFTVPMPSFGPPEPKPVAGPPRKVDPQQPSTTCGTPCQPGGGVPEVLLPSPGPR
jgi:hypothetical protein